MSKKFVNPNDECVVRYFKDIKNSSILTQDEEVELAYRIKDGDKKAKEILITSNLKFVVSIAKEYQGHGLALPDLINDGNEGLIKAAERFDPTRGFRFISYAVWWVRQSIIQGLNENSRTVRLPANVINKLANIRAQISKFENENERTPNENDTFQDETGLSVEFDSLVYPICTSLNVQINEDGDELGDLLFDDSAKKPDDDINSNKKAIENELKIALEHLTTREKEIVEFYFGLNPDFEAMTLEAIGDRFELTKERVRQIKEKAIRKLRHHIGDIFELL